MVSGKNEVLDSELVHLAHLPLEHIILYHIVDALVSVLCLLIAQAATSVFKASPGRHDIVLVKLQGGLAELLKQFLFLLFH